MDEYCLSIARVHLPITFFHKLKADIYRYFAECTMAEESEGYRQQAKEQYEIGLEYVRLLKEKRMERKQVDTIDWMRLSLILNYSVFLFDILKEKKKALKLLKKEIQNALDDFERWEPDQFK